MTDLEQYLTTVAQLRKSQTGCAPYTCMEAFVLQHGTLRQSTQPLAYPKGKMGECFRNAANLVLDYPELIYTEGFANSIIPMQHAWCETAEGIVVDPTWGYKSDHKNYTYFGVQFSSQYLRNTLSSRRKYGLLDNPEQKFPLLRSTSTAWKYNSQTPEL